MNWTRPTSPAEAHARAGGRRRHNRQKQLDALARQEAALNLYTLGYSRAEIGQKLGVCRVTIWRYLARPFDMRIKRPHSISFDSRRPLGQRWRVRPYR